MKRVSLTSAASLLALAGLLTLAPLLAEDPANSKSKKSGSEAASSRTDADKGDNERGDNARGGKEQASADMPSCLEKLKLTDEQHTKIRDIVAKYDADIESVWTKFKGRYRDTIRTEVMLITAIEDNLSPEQQAQVRMQRRKLAHEGKMAHNRGDAGQAQSGQRGETKAISDQKSDNPGRSDNPQRVGDQREGRPAPTTEAISLGNIELNEEQEQIAQELHDKYFGRLRSLSREIDSLHTRLVSLEADELAEIETVLTKEQLTQLREGRKECPAPSRVSGQPDSKSTR